VTRTGRRRLLPQVLDQPVDGGDPAAVDEQRAEQRAQLRSAQHHGLAVAQHLERSQQPELDLHPDSKLGTAPAPLPPGGVSDR
jgi:hypothetical protein